MTARKTIVIPKPDHGTKIIIGLVVVIIVMVLLYTLFGRNKRTDGEWQEVIKAKESEVSFIREQRSLDSLRSVKQDSLIDILSKQVLVRNYYVGQSKEKIKQLDKEIYEVIPNRVRNLSKDSLRFAAEN